MKFKLGDPVQKFYQYLNNGKGGYSESVFYIKAMSEDKNCQLAQETWPFNHFCYAHVSELRHAKFTKARNKEMARYRERDMRKS